MGLWLNFWGWGQIGSKGGFFDEAAEFFFTCAVVGAVFSGEVGHGFVFHFLARQLNDPKEFFTLLPDLALLEFKRVRHILRSNPSPLMFPSGEEQKSRTTFSWLLTS